MTTDEVNKCQWVIAIVVPQQLKGMKENHRKLADLEEWIKSFPPEEIFPRLRPSCDEYEVRVDYNMNRRVNESKKC